MFYKLKTWESGLKTSLERLPENGEVLKEHKKMPDEAPGIFKL